MKENNNAINASQAITKKSLYVRGGVIAWVIFVTGILYYCYAYLVRVYPSVMENNLLAHFGITAGTFGLLTSSYYFIYAPMQLPVGVSVDKIGPRKSLIFACLVSIIGILLFAISHNYALAIFGRLLAGFGAAFAYVTALKLASNWLPKKYFATATGVVTGAGMIAAIFTDMYLTHTVQTSGYQTALYFPIFMGVGLFVLIFLFVRNKPAGDTINNSEANGKPVLTFKQLGEYLLLIAKTPQMWIIGLVGALLYLPSSVFLDVWGIPYLENVYHLSPEDAAFGVSVMLTGWIISSFVSGYLSDLLKTRKIPLIIATAGAVIISSIILFVPGLPRIALFILLFLFGFICGPHPLTFTLSKENHSPLISGTVVAFTNFVIMMGGFIFQPVVGFLLNSGWSGRIAANGIHIYSGHDYVNALSLLPVGLFIACILTLFIKETYHTAVQEDE